jgi:hypothetical protein
MVRATAYQEKYTITVDRFPLPAVSPPVGDTSLTHVMRFAAHSTMSPRPTAMLQLFIIILYSIKSDHLCVYIDRYKFVVPAIN